MGTQHIPLATEQDRLNYLRGMLERLEHYALGYEAAQKDVAQPTQESKLDRKCRELKERLQKKGKPVSAPEPEKKPAPTPPHIVLLLNELYKNGRGFQTPTNLGRALGWSKRTVIRDLEKDPDVLTKTTYSVEGNEQNALRIPRVSVERLLARRASVEVSAKHLAPPR